MNGTISMILTTVAAFGSMPMCFGAEKKALPPDVEACIRGKIDSGDTVGVVVALIDAEGTTYHAFGHPAKGSDKPVNSKTIFEIGSITKVFTALLYEQLVNEGKIKPDDPIDKYLPAGTKTPQHNGKPVTLESLVMHTSGLPRLPGNMKPEDPLDPYADYTADLLHASLADCKIEQEIGSKYDYSNLGMGLLGHILSRVAGRTYEQLVIDRICTPLDMTDTRIDLSAEQKSRFAKGHADGKEVPPWALNSLAGAGALRSTAEDLAVFVRAAMGSRQSDLAGVFDQSCKQRHPAGDNLYIAHGWHISTRFGTEMIWHNGGTGGFRSWCGFRPDRKCGVVVLTNSTYELDAVARHLLEPKWELEKVRNVIVLAPELLERYVGYYELAPGVVFHITRDGNQLFAELTGQDRYPVFAEAETEFFYKVVDAQLSFVKGEDGKVTALILHQNKMDQKAIRKP